MTLMPLLPLFIDIYAISLIISRHYLISPLRFIDDIDISL
jgi:hypothetical protein